jgi:hypothetical protein
MGLTPLKCGATTLHMAGTSPLSIVTCEKLKEKLKWLL